jgi:hypothetical protein
MFKIVGGISLFAILGGLFAQNSLGTELASMLVIGGAVVGSINVLVEVASWFKR